MRVVKHVAAISVILCYGMPATLVGQTPMDPACGESRRWRLPESDVVERTAADTRSHQVIVTQARIDLILSAAEAFCRLNGGVYPRSFAEMISPPSAVAAAIGKCRLQQYALQDAWGRPIFYTLVSGRPLLTSSGEDGVFTTQDDIGIPVASDANAEIYDLAAACR